MNMETKHIEEVLKLSDILYRTFDGKKATHTEIVDKAKSILQYVMDISEGSDGYCEIIDLAIADFEKEVGTKTYEPDILQKDYDKDLWLYKVKPSVSHAYFDRYKLFLRKEGFSNKVIEKDIAPTCEKILARCADPKDENSAPTRGLVVGDVQSGKTANYLALINMAFDYGYKIVLLLAGMTDSLRIQTQKRTDKGVIGAISDSIGNQIKYCGVGEYVEDHFAVPFTNQKNDFAKFIKENRNAAISDYNKPVILVVKKNKKILESVNEHLQSALKDFDSSSILIIDDEADNASISTAPPGKDPTAINKCIRDIFNKFPIASYVGFTATPFANIFINPFNDDEHFLDLFPDDFIVQLHAPGNYFGGYQVFPKENDMDDINLPRPLRRISEEEKDFLPVKHDKFTEYNAIADSLKESILSFLINCVVRTIRGQKTKHRSMMINISRFNDVQKRIDYQIEQYIRELKNVIEQTDTLPTEKFIRNSEMKKLYQLYTTDTFYEDIRNGHFDFDEQVQYQAIPWNDIQKGLYEEISQFRVAIINSRNGKMSTLNSKNGDDKRFNYDDYEESGARVIAIGGYVLSRGLTLEGLMVSYYSRNASAYDTLLQMCRWFGYRPLYKDLCRVYMTQINIDCFSSVLSAVDDLKDQFSEMEQNRKKPGAFGIMVREKPDSLETTLLVTARNKSRTAKQIICQLNYGGVYADTSKLSKNPEINKANYNAFIKFYNLLSFNRKGNRYMAQKVDKQKVADFISELQIPYVNKKFDVEGLSEYIANSDVFDNWDVVIANGDSTRFKDFLVENQNATLRSFHTDSSDPYIRIGGNNNRVLDPSLLDSGEKFDREKILKEKNDNRKEGQKPSKELTARDYLKYRENPILIIFPIQLKTKASDYEIKALGGDINEARTKIETEKKRIDSLFCDIPLMAFAVAFPKKESDKRFVYKANLVKIKELTEGFDFGFDEDEEGDTDDD